MSPRFVAFGLLGSLTVAAAAGGSYLAVRRNHAEAPPVQQAAPAALQDQLAAAPPTAEPLKTPAPIPPAAVQPTPRAADRVRPPAAPAAAAAQPAFVPSSSPAVDPPAAVEPPAPFADTKTDAVADAPRASTQPFEDLTVTTDSVIGIRLDSTISSDTARVEDRVTARVTRDVVVGGHTAISAGARLEGVVTEVERGSKFKDRAHLGVRFQALILADGTRLPVQTETIFREGESPAAPAASKLSASAAVGGILGAILGGAKGAAIGSSVGAVGGTASVMAGGLPSVVLQAGTPLTVRLTSEVVVSIQKNDD